MEGILTLKKIAPPVTNIIFSKKNISIEPKKFICA